MVSEPNTGWCVSGDVGPPRRVDCDIPHWLERERKYFLIRVWKPLPSKRVLKS